VNVFDFTENLFLIISYYYAIIRRCSLHTAYSISKVWQRLRLRLRILIILIIIWRLYWYIYYILHNISLHRTSPYLTFCPIDLRRKSLDGQWGLVARPVFQEDITLTSLCDYHDHHDRWRRATDTSPHVATGSCPCYHPRTEYTREAWHLARWVKILRDKSLNNFPGHVLFLYIAGPRRWYFRIRKTTMWKYFAKWSRWCFDVQLVWSARWHFSKKSSRIRRTGGTPRNLSVRNPVCVDSGGTWAMEGQWLKAALKRGSLNNAISLMSFTTRDNGEGKEFLLR